MAVLIRDDGKIIKWGKKGKVPLTENTHYAKSDLENLVYIGVQEGKDYAINVFDAKGIEKIKHKYENCELIKMHPLNGRASMMYRTSDANGNVEHYQARLRSDGSIDAIECLERTDKDGIPIRFIDDKLED